MDVRDDDQRAEALGIFNKALRTPRFRRHRAKLWPDGIMPVVAALEDDLVVDVEARVRALAADCATAVVVYYPAKGSIRIVASLVGSNSRALGLTEADIHPNTSMGMLMELVGVTGGVYVTTKAEVLA